MSNKKPKSALPIIYATYYATLRDIARDHGYALALHGSMVTDLDLIAVPWIDKPKSHTDLIKAIKTAIGSPQLMIHILRGCGNKPHGRKVYTIISGAGGYIDLSILPITT